MEHKESNVVEDLLLLGELYSEWKLANTRPLRTKWLVTCQERAKSSWEYIHSLRLRRPIKTLTEWTWLGTFFVGKLTVVEVIVMKEIKLIIRGNFGKSTDLTSTESSHSLVRQK